MANMEHNAKILHLHDALLSCTCSWVFTYTGALTRKEATREIDRHLYSEYASEWRKTHSMSNPPSFTSWKQYYSHKPVVTT